MAAEGEEVDGHGTCAYVCKVVLCKVVGKSVCVCVGVVVSGAVVVGGAGIERAIGVVDAAGIGHTSGF